MYKSMPNPLRLFNLAVSRFTDVRCSDHNHCDNSMGRGTLCFFLSFFLLVYPQGKTSLFLFLIVCSCACLLKSFMVQSLLRPVACAEYELAKADCRGTVKREQRLPVSYIMLLREVVHDAIRGIVQTRLHGSPPRPKLRKNRPEQYRCHEQMRRGSLCKFLFCGSFSTVARTFSL